MSALLAIAGAVLGNRWVVIVGGCLIAAAALLILAYSSGYEHGEDNVAVEIREQNAKSDGAGGSGWDAVTECELQGREWDASADRCL
ncbi:hypothetical protein L1787_00225 [Acuticoccus sp. M5D2P5]|uniref:hypothetical protein n=1 Tax=Acuticoccus kalidii TaxID=2910977 RepID=UPI001F3312C0|nr:hypothetical protein [Acuticoccus kalidii]MCF3931836.1 hypothetical protein [Acuticoccus kalidii]